MRITFICHYASLTGYGRAARDYLAALAEHGGGAAEIAIVDWRSFPGQPPPAAAAASPEPRYAHLDGLVVEGWPVGMGPEDVVVLHAQPALLARVVGTPAWSALSSARARVALTTWETDALGSIEAASLAQYDATIVPSETCAGVMMRAGLSTFVVPHAFDPGFWPAPPMFRPTREPGPVRFYSLGAWSERKNHEGVLRAYLSTFTRADDVRLTIRGSGVEPWRLHSLLGRSGLLSEALPELHIEPDTMSEEQLRQFHLDNEVFVTATRGEGWGLPAFEATAVGNVVIAPLNNGMDDFLRDSHQLLSVPASRTPAFAGPGELIIRDGAVVGEKASRVPGMSCQQTWLEPDLVMLGIQMRVAADIIRDTHQTDLNAARTVSDRDFLERRFSYAAVAPRFLDVLQEIISP